MSKKKSQVKIKPYVYTDNRFKNLSIGERCLLELLMEEYEKAELEGRDRITLTPDGLEAKFAEKMREKKEKVKSQRFPPRDKFSPAK
jgi:hypothetical protein